MSLYRIFDKLRSLITVAIKNNSNSVPQEWSHITKIDPEEEKKLPALFPLYLQHTDAVSVGGSKDVTAENTEITFDLLSYSPTPTFHEPSSPEHVTEKTFKRSEFTAIPEVLNGDIKSIIGELGEGISHLQDQMVPQLLSNKLPVSKNGRFVKSISSIATLFILNEAVFEGYIIQNQDSAAAERAGVTEEDVLSPTVARERAMAADRHLGSEIVYVEYSGTYGGKEARRLIECIADDMTQARIWYGGGIDSKRKSSEMLDAGADAVVVGDIFHQIATDEISVLERATTFFEDKPTKKHIQSWIQRHIEVSSLASFRYLSSNTNVDSPNRLATKYLIASIYTLFYLMNNSRSKSNNRNCIDGIRTRKRKDPDVFDYLYRDDNINKVSKID